MAVGEKKLNWLSRLDPAGAPLYLQIADRIEAAVEAGLLRPGDRLPPQRRLAEMVGVDPTTATRAYAEARHRQLLDAVTGRGSFIAARTAQTGPAIDLGMNIPPAPKGVRLKDLMQRGIAEILARADVDTLMSYHVGAGSGADRAAACAWLKPILGGVDPARAAVCGGAQAALAALLTMLTEPGGALLTEPLVYPGVLTAARTCGRRIVVVESDAHGMSPAALQKAAKRHAAKAIYLNPTIQNPTTATTPEARRRELVRAARAAGVAIIEDDPYSLLADERPSAFAALDPERVFYVATLSKTLTPGLRTAFVVAPNAGECERFTRHVRALTLMPAPLMTALAAHWIRIGVADDVLNGVREEAAARQTLARAILPKTARAHPNGLHVWQHLPPHWTSHALAQALQREGLGVTFADAFDPEGRAQGAVRLSLGAVPERARLADALKRLAGLIAEARPSDHSVV